MAVFSIIIPCYNQAHFLPDCLWSIQEQSFIDWEAIVVNDGSPDNTTEIAKKFVEKDSRIRLVEKQNGGLSSARNKGIELAKGDFFLFLDADDLILNDCLFEYQKLISENKEFIQSEYLCFKNGRNDVLFKRTGIPQYTDFLKSILQSNVGPVNGFLISKKIVDFLGNFDESLTSCEDWDFWIRCAKAGFTPFVVNKIFAAYRYVPGSMGKNSIRMLEQGLRVLNTHYLGYDSFFIDVKTTEENTDYGKAVKFYLLFAVGIALYNNQEKNLISIKHDYFEKLSIKFTLSAFSSLSNYQTYRNLNEFRYALFYFKRSKNYHLFFKYLFENKIIDESTYSSLKYIIPTPFTKLFNKLKRRFIK